MVEQDTPVLRYLVIFAISNAILMVILNVILHGFDVDLGSGVNFGMVAAAACVAAGQFVSEKHRVPSKSEKTKLVWGSLGLSLLLSVVGLFSLALILRFDAQAELSNLLDRVSPGILVGIVSLAVVLYYFLLNFCYGSIARRFLDYRNKVKAV